MGGCQGGGKGVRGVQDSSLRNDMGEEEGRFPNRPYGNDGWERYAALDISRTAPTGMTGGSAALRWE